MAGNALNTADNTLATGVPGVPGATDETLAPLRERLLAAATRAIETLDEVQQSGDKDAARVAAASSILDRVGLVKPREPPPPNSLPAEVISAAITGLSNVFGKAMEMRETVVRDVTPDRPKAIAPAVAPASVPRKRKAAVPKVLAQAAEP